MTNTSAFKTLEGEIAFLAAYVAAMRLWPVPYEEIEIPSRFGMTHVVTSGPKDAPPLVLLHGYISTLTMWSPNVADFSKDYRVYAIDVGYGQLAWKLQQDPRVLVMDRTNARHLQQLPEPVDLVAIDVSFISLKLILPAAIGWLRKGGQIVALIKPQFEAGREQVGKGGVVRDPALHERVVSEIKSFCHQLGLDVLGTCESPITGPEGNKEFFVYLKNPPEIRAAAQTGKAE